MAETSTEAHQSSLFGLFKKSTEGRLKAGDLKKKLKIGSKEGPDGSEIDQALAELIDQGFIAVAGGSKEGHHPRPGASYRLTDQGKHHLRPPRPDFSDEQLEKQEAFILLQVFRAKEGNLTRSDLNGKLKTRAAIGQLEFDVKGAPETVDYHLAALVAKGCLDERKRGNSVGYALSPTKGAKALAVAKQHDAVSFTMSGELLNALLEVAAGSGSGSGSVTGVVQEPETSSPSPLRAEDIANYIDQLRTDKYAGQELIPIHEVRRLVAQHHGEQDASHPTFDPLLKRMRSEGQVELIAINDKRSATQEELDASIPGMNETIFFIVIE